MRIQIIVGGLHHDFDGFTAHMSPVLEEAGHTVASTYDLDVLTVLGNGFCDLVLSYTSLSAHRKGQGDTNPETLSPDQIAGLSDWVQSGGALLAVHSATVSGRSNATMRSLIGGVFVSHPPRFTFTVYPMNGAHPITQGIDAFCVNDEFYIQDYDASLDIHMVAMDRGAAHPMVWSKSEGKGRVACIAMGHSEEVWALVPYRRLLLQAANWLTGLEN